jgi:hypothetical protein
MKYVLVFVGMMAMSGAVCAQATGVLKNKKITREEVPVAVMAAFQKDFPQQAEGAWSVFYSVQPAGGGQLQITPRWYVCTAKTDHKAVVQYSPAGKLERSKGMGKDVELAGGNSPDSKGGN